MPLKIALTGATGFVGRAVVSALKAKSCQVSALVRDPARAGLNSNVRQVQGDLQNSDALADLTRNADAVVHIAGVIGALSRNDFFLANEQGSRAVAEAAARNGVKRFVHISSLAARAPQLSPQGAGKRGGETAAAACRAGSKGIGQRHPARQGRADRGARWPRRSLSGSQAGVAGRSTAPVEARDVL